jgi:hypothetical protein
LLARRNTGITKESHRQICLLNRLLERMSTKAV